MAKAKPFIKWVGGKGQLLEQLEALLPADFDNVLSSMMSIMMCLMESICSHRFVTSKT